MRHLRYLLPAIVLVAMASFVAGVATAESGKPPSLGDEVVLPASNQRSPTGADDDENDEPSQVNPRLREFDDDYEDDGRDDRPDQDRADREGGGQEPDSGDYKEDTAQDSDSDDDVDEPDGDRDAPEPDGDRDAPEPDRDRDAPEPDRDRDAPEPDRDRDSDGDEGDGDG